MKMWVGDFTVYFIQPLHTKNKETIQKQLMYMPIRDMGIYYVANNFL